MDFSFQIGEDTYEVPTELTTSRFEQAMSWDIEDPKNHKPFVSAITECPLQVLNLLDENTFNMILAVCVSILPVEGTLNRQNGVYVLKEFDEFNFGDFIDIDIYIADGLTKHVVDLVAKLYSMPVKVAAEIEVNRIWTALIAISKWRELVYKEHDEFFELSNSSGDNDQEFTINNLQLMWYEAVLALADHQFLNIQHVVQRPYKEALNFLTWKKNEIAKQQLEQVKRNYALQKRSR